MSEHLTVDLEPTLFPKSLTLPLLKFGVMEVTGRVGPDGDSTCFGRGQFIRNLSDNSVVVLSQVCTGGSKFRTNYCVDETIDVQLTKIPR